ncbi:Phosphoheptose isomerase [BD1-7 clade bacterium]|uniref:Phosphoheptose isomerase n=1 Tax=BD1-7 clade bacterium TaxID=2029982 RepID=A0A5S9NKP6_9GAMM|nr:Phosphoheptose isomerase [BD1-7 clade bacterium]CAA0093740.1 Phosphoheptose isomerase [BD1-7 clade bacterium]
MKALIKQHIRQSIETKEAILTDEICVDAIQRAATACKDAIAAGNKILLAGNGGSAADAQHIAAELVGRFEKERPSMPSIALTTDTSALTAIGNDYGYDHVFSRQLQGLGQAGDVFIGISTSGNSGNVIKAVDVAKEKQITTILLSGKDGGKLANMCDINIIVPCDRTATIQESHIMIGHMLCALIEN